MRSMWKGHIRFSLVTIPIQIFNAVDNSNAISFRQLHNEDNGAIQYKKICSVCQEEVPYNDIVKGYEYDKDAYVIIDKDELDGLKIKSSRVIEIEAFVNISEVSPSRFESVYFVGPNGDIAHSTFNLLTKTLKSTNKAGVGRIVIRDREDVVLIVPEGNGLIMYKMRYPEELKAIEDVPELQDTKVDAAQLSLAETLVESLTTSFDEINFEDHYKTSIMELVDSKIEGKEIVSVIDDVEEAPVVDIMQALKRSIEDAKAKSKAK